MDEAGRWTLWRGPVKLGVTPSTNWYTLRMCQADAAEQVTSGSDSPRDDRCL